MDFRHLADRPSIVYVDVAAAWGQNANVTSDRVASPADDAGAAGDERERLLDEREQAVDARERAADQREIEYQMREAGDEERQRLADERDVAQDRREADESQRQRSSDARQLDRERTADERDLAADQRDGVADERDRAADQRARDADQRDDMADKRDRAADQREIDAELVSGSLDDWGAPTDDRSAVGNRPAPRGDYALTLSPRSLATGSRLDAALENARALIARSEALLERATAASLWQRATSHRDRNPQNERRHQPLDMIVLRRRTAEQATKLADNEGKTAELFDQLAAQHPDNPRHYRDGSDAAREGARRAREAADRYGQEP